MLGSLALESFIRGLTSDLPSNTRGRSPVPELDTPGSVRGGAVMSIPTAIRPAPHGVRALCQAAPSAIASGSNRPSSAIRPGSQRNIRASTRTTDLLHQGLTVVASAIPGLPGTASDEGKSALAANVHEFSQRRKQQGRVRRYKDALAKSK
jgi:hypothetical protein